MDSTEWKAKYRIVILATNPCASENEISDAEAAIVARTHELFHSTGTDVELEREALDEAMYALHALQGALKHGACAA